MGRKWVLRACARALFRAVGVQWHAGEIRKTSEIPRRLPLSETLRARQQDIAEYTFQSHKRAELACLAHKNHCEKDFFITGIQLECLAYLIGLAEVNGFQMALALLGKVWWRAVERMRWEE